MTVVTDPLLVTRDPGLAEVVLASAAALGRSVQVVRDADGLRRCWRSAALVLVGADSAELVSALALPGRARVYLVGTAVTDLAAWSVGLGASVVPLPDVAGALAALFAGPQAGGGASAYWVLGAGGGLGCSTLVAALTCLAAQRRKVAAVELDPCGGLDLVFGAEAAAGWRWPELASAVGQVGDLTGRLPKAAGVDIVAVGRDSLVPPTPEALAAVAGSLARTHEVVVFDGGLTRPPISGVRVMLVVGADVRSVAAARALVGGLDLADAELVVRSGPGRSIAPAVVGDAVGLPVLGVVPSDRGLPRLLEAGRVPGSARGRYRRAVARLIAEG